LTAAVPLGRVGRAIADRQAGSVLISNPGALNGFVIGNGRKSRNLRQLQELSPMITSIHTLIYSDDAPATRAFLRNVLGWPYVEDVLGGGAGWLIFKTGRSEMGVHPTHSVYDGKTYESPRHHLISLMCDDISRTVVELKGKGAEFRGEVQDQGYGLVVMMAVPGADDIMLYEPKHPLAYSL
jgi:catechol 2,3-dioxygenase-like lactoylglutathione lyase family enzyme